MPETGIGFVPDIGASYFLSRCPGEIGMYLALTGARIGLGDALASDLISAQRRQIRSRSADRAPGRGRDSWRGHCGLCAGATATRPWTQHRARIDTIFAASSVEAILERLDRDGDDFRAETARLMRTRSPTSLKLAFRLMREGKACR